MASRHRRRKRVELNQRMSAYGNEALSYAEVPFSPELSRPGLDPEVVRALQATDELVLEMRRGLNWPSQVFDEDSAVERYLVYVSVLIDSVLSDITMSAFMKNDLMVHSKMRILAEYVVKAAYYSDHPDYALYMMTIGDAKSALHKLKDAKSDPTIIASGSCPGAWCMRRLPS